MLLDVRLLIKGSISVSHGIWHAQCRGIMAIVVIFYRFASQLRVVVNDDNFRKRKRKDATGLFSCSTKHDFACS
jgi:hypothetical protein